MSRSTFNTDGDLHFSFNEVSYVWLIQKRSPMDKKSFKHCLEERGQL